MQPSNGDDGDRPPRPRWGVLLAALFLLAMLLLSLWPAYGEAEENAARSAGRAAWIKHCRYCHANPGMLRSLGVRTPAELQPWTLAGQDPKRFNTVVRQGVGKMPAFASLTDEQLEAIRRYLVAAQRSTPPGRIP